jgi:hypothetical protein
MAAAVKNSACPEADRLVGPLSDHTYGWLFGRFSAVRAALMAQGAGRIPPPPEASLDPTVRALARQAAASGWRGWTKANRGGGVPARGREQGAER